MRSMAGSDPLLLERQRPSPKPCPAGAIGQSGRACCVDDARSGLLGPTIGAQCSVSAAAIGCFDRPVDLRSSVRDEEYAVGVMDETLPASDRG